MSAMRGQFDDPGDSRGHKGDHSSQKSGSADALSALERALRKALDVTPRDQVVKCIVTVLPTSVFMDEISRLHSGKVKKVSVSMPEELAEAVRARTGAGGFSRYVADAVHEQVMPDLTVNGFGHVAAEAAGPGARADRFR